MTDSILNGKCILAVDDEPDILEVLAEEILAECPEVKFVGATTFEEGLEKLASQTYGLVILDIMGVRGFDLLKRAVSRGIPAVMLTAHSLSPNAMKESIELGARGYIPKDKLGEIVPFLEDVMQYEDLPGGRIYDNLREYFNERWGKYWQKPEEKFWTEFEGKTGQTKS